jgi:hypothetical protein
VAENPKLRIWRCHPGGVRIVPAEKTLNGTAHPAGVKWCQPYATANRMGWWVHSPADLDITWRGGRDFDHKELSPYPATDAVLLRSLLLPTDLAEPDKWCPLGGGRTKYNWGGVDEGVVQIWSGVILQTPPGWCLHMRSPVNCERQAFSIQEGVLETDWMRYDLWINLKFDEPGVEVKLRRDQWPPLAHLVPVRREVFKEEWGLEEETINRDTPEAAGVLMSWVEYNREKFCSGGQQHANAYDPDVMKDSTTFYRLRKKYLGRGVEPDREATQPPPVAGKKMIRPFARRKTEPGRPPEAAW